MNWLNEPPAWSDRDSVITIQSAHGSDFWRVTHYGFTHDNGHFYYQIREGDFQAEVKFSGDYNSLYDQAGLMLRLDEKNWMKCGIEFIEGVRHLSAVVTREFSDWALGIPLPTSPRSLWLRLKRTGDAVEVLYALDGTNYQLLRIAYLPPSTSSQIGVMCASPEGTGFTATFENFTLEDI